MMPTTRDQCIKAILLIAMLTLGGGALAGCGQEAEAPDSPDAEEPMGQGPMSNDENAPTGGDVDEDL